MGALNFCLYASSIYVIQGWLELHHTRLAGVTSYTAGWIFIHLHHPAALSKPHCAYNQKLGAPVRSTLLDDFGVLQLAWHRSVMFVLNNRNYAQVYTRKRSLYCNV